MISHIIIFAFATVLLIDSQFLSVEATPNVLKPYTESQLCLQVCESCLREENCNFSKIKCQNGNCNETTGKCSCDIGYTGIYCEEKCIGGKWGENCSQNCDCKNGCHHITGHCRDANTENNFVCPEGKYGKTCDQNCTCPENNICHPIYGNCFCNEGWTGVNCSEQKCQEGYFGPTCDVDCECSIQNTLRCDSQTGTCQCAAGWYGSRCSKMCPSINKIDEKFKYPCYCRKDAKCSPKNGACGHLITTPVAEQEPTTSNATQTTTEKAKNNT